MLVFHCVCVYVCVCTPIFHMQFDPKTAEGLEHPSCLSLKYIQTHTMETAGLLSCLLDPFLAKMPIWHLQV